MLGLATLSYRLQPHYATTTPGCGRVDIITVYSLPPTPALSTRTPIVHHRIAMTGLVNFAIGMVGICVKYSLWKNLNSTTPKSLITNAAHLILTNQDMAVPSTVTARNAISKPQLRLFAKDQTASQSTSHSAFVDGRVCRPYPTAKIWFELFDREDLGYEVQSR